MSDSAFKSHPFPGFTIHQLRERVAAWETESAAAVASGLQAGADVIARMRIEIARREAVAAGDVSQMTAGERLRHVKRESGTC